MNQVLAWLVAGILRSGDPAATMHGVLYGTLLPAAVFLAAWRMTADAGGAAG
jgi:hypothetical protein